MDPRFALKDLHGWAVAVIVAADGFSKFVALLLVLSEPLYSVLVGVLGLSVELEPQELYK